MPRKAKTADRIAAAKPMKSGIARPARRRRTVEAPFWETKTLAEMTRAEWESLCDGCGKCCLLKFEYEDTGEIDHTNVACRYLDKETCRCTEYKRRHKLVEDCISLTAKLVGNLSWLPSTCAYRLLDEGKKLPRWHPLITGDPDSVRKAGISVAGRIVSEDEVEDPEDHIVDWLK